MRLDNTAKLLAAFRKQDLIQMAEDLGVKNEISRRDNKATIVANLDEVLCEDDVLDWAELAGFRVTQIRQPTT